MKRKKLKLKRTGPYSPVIAVLGGKNVSDSILVDYGRTINKKEQPPKTKTKIMVKTRIRKNYAKSEE